MKHCGKLIEKLEQKLDSFDSAERKEALITLCEKVKAGEVTLPKPGSDVNLHCHTFFSYNSYGYSPSRLAWLARKAGLAVGGIIDFDVLDALDEFLEAARMFGLKACAGLETRVFVPEFSERVINSPGEPGIAYHVGIGFAKAKFEHPQQEFLLTLRKTAQQRNLRLTEQINKYLSPVKLDYENDVLPLTPSNNPTERHICLAYARKAKEVFGDDNALAQFWAEKLDADTESLKLLDSRELLNMIRAKTMKRGGVGYVVPDKSSFPLMADTNRFILACGAIPTLAWLDGTSDGERAIEELLKISMKSGVAAINIIPDRNYTPSVKDEKLRNLCQMVDMAESLGLPVVVGTEMNSPGQKFVDSFDSKELSPMVAIFLKGAHIVYAHSVLQQKCSLGYTSDWAGKNFESIAEKNEFFRQLGSLMQPKREDVFVGLSENTTTKEILDKVRN